MRLLSVVFLSVAAIYLGGAAAAERCDEYSVAVATTPAPPYHAAGLKTTMALLSSVPDAADVVVVGDSLFEMWKSTLTTSFPSLKVWDFAVGGDRTQQVLKRLGSDKIVHLRPKAVILLVGTNNLNEAGTSGCSIYYGVTSIVKKMSSIWPEAKKFVLTIPPRGADYGDHKEKISEYNELVKGINDIDRNSYPVIIDNYEFTCGKYGTKVLEKAILACKPEMAMSCKNYRDDNLHFNKSAYFLIRKYISEASVRWEGKDIFQKDEEQSLLEE